MKRNIPDDNLAYPLLIILDNNATGSGFFLNANSSIFLVTAKHVLFDDKGVLKAHKARIISQAKEINDDSQGIDDIDIDILNNSKNIYFHPEKDVAAVKVADITPGTMPKSYIAEPILGVTRIQKTNTGIVSVAQDSVLLLKDVLVSNDIFLYGYPLSIGLQESPQFVPTKPLLRKGIVASINKDQGTIILDCPVYYGNSGGPVVQITRHDHGIHHGVIGVVSQFIPYVENWVNTKNNVSHTEISNSGYSVVVAMDYVFEILSII